MDDEDIDESEVEFERDEKRDDDLEDKLEYAWHPEELALVSSGPKYEERIYKCRD